MVGMKHDKIYNRPHNEVLVKSEDSNSSSFFNLYSIESEVTKKNRCKTKLWIE